jgi:DNA-binding beta-propeller fold protein YncE
MRRLAALLVRTAGARVHGQASACTATAVSLTPPTWHSTSAPSPPGAPSHGPRAVADILLPRPANRFEHQSVDDSARRLYVSHMDAGRLVAFDLDASKVIGEVPGVDRATGVWAVPGHHAVYVSAAGRHELAAVGERTLAVTARVGGIRLPDGIAYAPPEHKVFVSDESGAADVVIVIDARTNTTRSTIPLGGRPATPTTTRCRTACSSPCRRATSSSRSTPRGSGRLYVASESGVVSVFAVDGATLRPLGTTRTAHAHTVAVDPRTHRVYLPLENVGGPPVLRVLEPVP